MTTHTTDIHDLLRARRSGRAYDAAHEVTREDILPLLEAARWAPSGGNTQPWRYVVGIKGDATYDKLLDLLAPGNRIWAQYAPVLLLTAYQSSRKNQAGEWVDNRGGLHDLGMANLSIAVEAVNRGMMAHMVGGFNHDAARTLIDAPTNHLDVGPMMALGYEGTPHHLPEDIQKRETATRVRKPIEELLLDV
jgi:nitroreductase